MNLLRAGLISAVMLLGLAIWQGALQQTRALEPLPAPTGSVILTVGGKIAIHNTANNEAAFDLAMLEALPRSSFKTTTIWTDGVQEFVGVSVTDLLSRLGSDATQINAIATNDYEIRFPVSDASEHGGIVAYRANGKPLPPGNKGPLWIIFPFDSDPLLQSERFQGESIWNLATMTLH
nr:molybdopterin-dependent oxidoreductase [uncultured Dongia sp.]